MSTFSHTEIEASKKSTREIEPPQRQTRPLESHLSSWSDSDTERSWRHTIGKLFATSFRTLRQRSVAEPATMVQGTSSYDLSQASQPIQPTPTHDIYRTFHHPFASPPPAIIPQQDQYPIFLDQRPANRLEAILQANKLKRYRAEALKQSIARQASAVERPDVNFQRQSEKQEGMSVGDERRTVTNAGRTIKDETEGVENSRKKQRRSAVSLKLQSTLIPSDPDTPYISERSTVALRFEYIFTKYVIEWWLLEMISWIFSALCMTTIIGVLWFLDGKQLPAWKLGITLNGFISVFSNLARVSLILPTAEALGQLKWNWFRKESKTMLDFEILDSASRGPWGAFALLLRTRGR